MQQVRVLGSVKATTVKMSVDDDDHIYTYHQTQGKCNQE